MDRPVLTPPLEAYQLDTIRPTRIEIDLSKIGKNLTHLYNYLPPKTKIMGIVKANAYGHGLGGISKFLESQHIDALGVGFIEEGIILRKLGIESPILVLGGVLGYQIELFHRHNLEVTISSIELAESVNEMMGRENARIKVHLKIDTGMGRIGIKHENAPAAAEKIARLPHVELVGLYSHFATADGSDDDFMKLQLERFDVAVRKIRSMGIEVKQIHIANSGAILAGVDAVYSMVRPGLCIYGILPNARFRNTLSIEPALSLKSRIVFIKEVDPGVSISYGRTYYTTKKTRIATIPIGYGDGYSRMLSNKAEVLIKGKRFPLVGSVCMDQVMIDIDEERDLHVGDEVTLIGCDGEEEISVWELAWKIGTTPYEVLCGISARVPRYYINTKHHI